MVPTWECRCAGRRDLRLPRCPQCGEHRPYHLALRAEQCADGEVEPARKARRPRVRTERS